MMHRGRSTAALPTILLTLSGICGCYQVTTSSTETVYGYSWWVSFGVLALALLLLPVGWFVYFASSFRSLRMLAAAVMAAGVLGACLFAPAFYHIQLVVSDDQFERRGGLFSSTTNLNVRFADLARMDVVRAASSQTTESKRYLVCVGKGGEERQIEVSDLFEQALEDILTRARRQGVAIGRQDQ